MKAQLEQQNQVVAQLKKNMRTLEGKIAEARTKKDMYIARARSAEASRKINEMIGQVGTSGALAAFERMEEKVSELEVQSEAIAELNASSSLEGQFTALETGQDIDIELAAMKAKLLSGEEPANLPPAE